MSHCSKIRGRGNAGDLLQGLEELRATLDPKVVQKFEALDVCYSTLTDRIMNELPKDKQGVVLVPSEHFKANPLHQVCPQREVHSVDRVGLPKRTPPQPLRTPSPVSLVALT